MLKIYFAGSIRGGRNMAHEYHQLIEKLQVFGTVFTEHVGNEEAISLDEKSMSDVQIHDRDLDWIRESDLMVAEVTIPSLGVGYEIARAIQLKKPVVCLFHEQAGLRLSAMISGSKEVAVIRYGSIEAAINETENYILNM